MRVFIWSGTVTLLSTPALIRYSTMLSAQWCFSLFPLHGTFQCCVYYFLSASKYKSCTLVIDRPVPSGNPPVQEVGVQRVQAHHQKFWFGKIRAKSLKIRAKSVELWAKSVKTFTKSLKIWGNTWKYERNRCPASPKITWRAFFGGHFLWSFFRQVWENSGKNP